MYILISACLLGVACKYSGGSNANTTALAALRRGDLTFIPVCPECYGGMPIPRPPCERVGDKVLSKTGADMTAAYTRGAQATLQLAKLYGCRCAVLKERSPSCGHGAIYDGSFTGTLIPGDGVTAALLQENGITVLGESDLPGLLESTEFSD